MAGDVANPRIWINSDVYVAPVGTTAPVDVDTVLNAAFEALGLLSEDATEWASTNDATDHYARGGILVRTTKSKHKQTVKVTALEDNPVVFGLIHPGSTAGTVAGLTTRVVKIPVPDPRAFVVEDTDGDVIRRRVIPRGEIVEVGPEQDSDSDMTKRELTINVYPASDGTLWHEITNDPAAVVVP